MEDRFFFNPYGFPGGFGGFGVNLPPNISLPPNIANNPNANKMTPKEFYENQYYYYRCLNESIDYQIKYQDYMDKMNRNTSAQNKSI